MPHFLGCFIPYREKFLKFVTGELASVIDHDDILASVPKANLGSDESGTALPLAFFNGRNSIHLVNRSCITSS